MSRPQLNDRTPDRPFFPNHLRKQYWIVRREGVCFIKFDGDEYGPYQSEREAMLFAVDAAKKLAEQGEDTQVLTLDENGDGRSAWVSG